MKTVVYREVPGFRPLEADIYLPPEPGPTIVYLHGGGWRRGSRRYVLPALGEFYPRLAAEGFAVVAVDYRLSGEARFPAPLEDVRAAVEWVRDSGPSWGLDRNRVFLWGESAGAHLALLAALGGCDVSGVVAWFPPTDLLGLPADRAAAGGEPDDSRETELLGAHPHATPDLARAASPLTFAHPDAPPILLLHGVDDDMVPAAQSIRLAEALTAVGARPELDLVPGARHLWVDAPDTAAIVRRSVDFLRSIPTE